MQRLQPAVFLVAFVLIGCRDGPTVASPPSPQAVASLMEDPLVHVLLEGLEDRELAARLRRGLGSRAAVASASSAAAAPGDVVTVAALALMIEHAGPTAAIPAEGSVDGTLTPLPPRRPR